MKKRDAKRRRTAGFLALVLLAGALLWKVFHTLPAMAKEGALLKEEKGVVALTFDDGPHPRYTPLLLDGLKKRGVKASFFVTGKNAEQYPELIRRMDKEGHLIGNHTYSHLQLSEKNREQFREELVKTNGILKEITGKDVEFVRPPYGSWDKNFEAELNMFPVLWNLDPLDWSSRNAQNVEKKVLAAVEDGSVILLHDEYASTVTAAFGIVDELRREGYRFVTVEELLFD